VLLQLKLGGISHSKRSNGGNISDSATHAQDSIENLKPRRLRLLQHVRCDANGAQIDSVV